MAFPTGYTKYQEVTIDATQVPADQTDFTIYVNLADLSKAGADIFDTCRSDGGDIRVTKSDGTTELAREVVDIDTTGKTGTLFVKFTGTLSSSTDTVIRIWYNGTDTEPAVTATYGRNNAWDSSYEMVLHLSEAANNTTDGYVDSTGNDRHGTGTSMAEAARTGKLAGSNGASFDGANDYITVTGDATVPRNTLNSIEYWMYWDARSTNDVVIDETSVGYERHQQQSSTSNFNANGSSASGLLTTSAWHMAQVTSDHTNAADSFFLRFNNAKQAEATSDRGTPTGDLRIGSYASGTALSLNGIMQEIRWSSVIRSDNWLTTHYNNQNAPATFYSTGDEQEAGLAPIAMNTQVIASSAISPTVTAVQNVSIAVGTQVIASSVPASSVSTTSTVTFVPATQVIASSAISPVVDAGGNVTLAIGTQTVSAVAVSPTVAVEATITVAVSTQSIVSSVISPTVTADENTVLVMNTQTMQLSTVERTLEGSIWGKVGWEDTVDDWTEIARTT